MKTILIIAAIVLDTLYLIYSFVSEAGKLRRELPHRRCEKLQNEKCSSSLWNSLMFKRKKSCPREKCPAFCCVDEKGERLRPFSRRTVLETILKQMPALAALLLLCLKLYE